MYTVTRLVGRCPLRRPPFLFSSPTCAPFHSPFAPQVPAGGVGHAVLRGGPLPSNLPSFHPPIPSFPPPRPFSLPPLSPPPPCTPLHSPITPQVPAGGVGHAVLCRGPLPPLIPFPTTSTRPADMPPCHVPITPQVPAGSVGHAVLRCGPHLPHLLLLLRSDKRAPPDRQGHVHVDNSVGIRYVLATMYSLARTQ